MTEPLDALALADVIDRAHDELMIRGWCQRDYKHEGRVCTIGAVYAASGCLDYPSQRHDRIAVQVEAVLSRLIDPQSCGLTSSTLDGEFRTVTHWNDADERTVDDALDLLRNASKQLREEASA